MAYIQVIDHSEAEGELKEIYDDLVKNRGKLADIHKIQSLNPKSIVNHMELYMTIMFGKSPLRRYQREMIAVVVSVANKCAYCMEHHGAALQHYWKDEEKLARFKESFVQNDISPEDKLLCQYAQTLTLTPNKINEEIHISALKEAGFSHRAILDTALVTAYFNFVNRLVLGLGVQLEQDKGEGYKY